MHTHRLRVLFSLALRTIAVVIATIAITGCNMPKPTPSGNGGSDTGGPYATSQKSLGGAGGSGANVAGYKCPLPGVTDYYNLCFNHKIDFKLSDDYGYTLTPYPGTHCVLLGISPSKVINVSAKDDVHASVAFELNGTWDFPNEKCTLSGQVTLNVSVYAHGDPPCTRGNRLHLTVWESWAKAPVQGKCVCKKNCGNPPHTPSPIEVTLPMLEDRAVDLAFTLPNGLYIEQAATNGPFTVQFIYEVKPAAEIPSELETPEN
jgi:hypothetical protein